MLWRVPDLNRGWLTVVSDVREFGERVAPRGQPTREVLGATIVVENPANVLPVGITRKPHLPIAAAEALQLIGGVSHPDLMCKIGSKFSSFMDDGTFHGAYGPRVRAQMPSVLRRLSQDSNTRQALLTIWDPAVDAHVDGLKDYPCTTVLHFMVREKRLILCVTMRSNDVYWGLTYDAFQFTQLQMTVARALGIEAGAYYHQVNSLHVYERDFEAIDQIVPIEVHPPSQPDWLTGIPPISGSDPVQRFESAATIARQVLNGAGENWIYTNKSTEWYIDQLRKYQSWYIDRLRKHEP